MNVNCALLKEKEKAEALLGNSKESVEKSEEAAGERLISEIVLSKEEARLVGKVLGDQFEDVLRSLLEPSPFHVTVDE